MCGKSNPADADICRYCQARLKPLGPSLGKNATPAPAEGDARASSPAGEPQGSSDWLRGLLEPTGSASAPDESSPAIEPPPADDSSADWLARIVSQETAENSPPPPQPASSASSPAEEPQGGADWLGEFNAPGAASPAAGNDDLSKWLASLREEDEPTPAAPSASSPALRAPAGEPPGGSLPAWMNDFESSAADSPAALPGDVPDWLKKIKPASGAPEAAATPPADPQGGTAQRFGAPAEGQPPAQSTGWQSPEPEDALSADDLPDWLKDLDAPSPAEPIIPPPPRAEIAPDWLSKVNSAANQRFVAPEGGQPAEPPADSDWMADFDAPAAGEPAVPPAIPTAPAEVPDWLRDFQNTPPAATATPAEGQSEAQSETPAAPADVPDWLRDFQASPTPPTTAPLSQTEDQAAPEPPAAEGVLLPNSNDKTPDWLSEFYAAPTVDSTGKQTEADTDWMKDLNDSSAQHESRQPADTLPGADLPDWLRSASQPAAQDNAGGDQELPDWLKKEGGRLQPFSQQEPIADEAAPPFASREMSELLEGVSSESPQALETSVAGEKDMLEPAQLPNWLQAMRPVESGVSSIPTSEADDSRVEKSGPLAGLRGVLPGEDLVSKYRKPPIYTNKLQVSEKQHLHTSLLEGLVNEETQSQPLPGESIRASQLITRLLVAVLLIALIVLPPLLGFKLAVPSALRAAQPGVNLMAQSLTSLPRSSYVLVVADFEAGLTGELKAAAQPVLRDLQKRQARVVLASTLPAGPVLGEMLLKDAKITPLANLGYLAGGAQTLKRLAAPASKELPDPLAQIAPFIYPGGRSWNDVADLRGLHAVTDFQRIVVLTDSVETARAWVEQVQPGLGTKTQLVMVSSAQAAPLLRTYLESGQVHGLVSGVAGGAAYEQFTGQPGLAADSWTAYQLSMLAVIFLIVAGAVAAGLSNLFRRNKKRKV